jgi:hypothetical protein
MVETIIVAFISVIWIGASIFLGNSMRDWLGPEGEMRLGWVLAFIAFIWLASRLESLERNNRSLSARLKRLEDAAPR